MKNNFYKYYKKINKTKIYILLLIMLIFSVIYTFLDDTHFEGVNKYKEIIKEEIIKKKAQKEIKENYQNINNTFDQTLFNNNKKENINKKEIVIDETTKETEQDVEKNELNPEKVKPSLINKVYTSFVQ